jgi:rod shape-determining protein MreD
MNTSDFLGRNPSKSLIYTSLAFALFFNFIPFGHSIPFPDMVAVVLVFWNAFLPTKVGLLIAWVLGIIMDVHSGSLLGQHALAYSILSYGAISLHRRLLWYSTFSQTIQIVPLFAVSMIIIAFIRYIADGGIAPWWFFFRPIFDGCAWIIVSWILQNIMNKRREPSIETRKVFLGK